VAGLFPPQDREWSLPAEVPLTPQAATRLGREAATQQGFEPAARAVNQDWALDQPLHAKQVRRWSEELGRSMVSQREAEVHDYQCGQRPVCPPNGVPLMVIGVDGGRYQSREKDPVTGSRWREEKVLTISSYVPGDGKEKHEGGRAPQKLVTTHLATAQSVKAFGPLARVEAERRGLRQAEQVIALGDGGNWIDPLLTAFFHVLARIIDWFHASEHLWDCAKAVHGAGTPQAAQWAEQLEALLWDGQVQRVIAQLSAQAQQLGPPLETDTAAASPRKVLANNVAYFTEHQRHMNYPEYRRRGWPIGSGETEAAVKQFNKRIKGTEQFWSTDGVEAILALRASWLSQDDRWQRYWENRSAYVN
jgi:hypothetical protein